MCACGLISMNVICISCPVMPCMRTMHDAHCSHKCTLHIIIIFYQLGRPGALRKGMRPFNQWTTCKCECVCDAETNGAAGASNGAAAVTSNDKNILARTSTITYWPAHQLIHRLDDYCFYSRLRVSAHSNNFIRFSFRFASPFFRVGNFPSMANSKAWPIVKT